jgi:septal ring factor EnvC (AmiA/AmiB activator)
MGSEKFINNGADIAKNRYFLLSLLAGLSALCIVLFILPAMVLAQSSVLPDQTLSDQRDALKTAEEAADAAKRRADRLMARAEQASESAEKAKREVEAVAAQVQATEARITAIEARIAIISQLQSRQRARLAERQEPVMRLTAALQQQSRRPASLALVKPGSVNDLVHLRAAMAAITPQVDAISRDVRDDLERSRKLREQADIAANALRGQQTQLNDQRSALAVLETQNRLTATNLVADARREEDRAIALSEDARDITQLIGRIENSARLREQLAALPGPILPLTAGAGKGADGAPKPDEKGKKPVYMMPVAGQVLTGFGEVSTSGVSARGVRLKVREQAQITAPAAGRIEFAGAYRGYGQIIIIEHGDGWTSLITGIDDIDVSAGANITQGAPLGQAIGGTQSVLLELRRKGKPVDVATLIAAG